MAPPRKHTTDAILDAARDLVLDDGPRAASVAALAKASGAPTGTLYHRFGSRDGVLAAIWVRAVERFLSVALPTEPEADPVERGTAMARAAVHFAAEHPEDARLLALVRRSDLLDGEPPAALLERLAALNAPAERALAEIAQALLGRADHRAIEHVVRAVVDLPTTAVRRHAGRDQPAWLADDVAAAARTLLEALARQARPAR